MVSADSHRIPRAPCYWGPRPRSPPGSAYGAVTRCGPPSQGIRLPDKNTTAPRRGGDGKNAPRQHRARNPRRVIARARFNHHPLPLATTHGISTPAGTEMFHFPASPPAPYDIQTRVTPHNGRRVPPFGNPRITARKPAPRGISQATASFIGPRCQGIHRTLIKTNNTQQHNTRHAARQTAARPRRTNGARPRRSPRHCGAPTARTRTGARRTTNQTKKQTNGRPAAQSRYRGRPQMLASTMQFTTNPPTTPDPPQQQEGPEGPDTRAHRPRTRQHATPPTPRPATSGSRRGDEKRGRGPGPRPTAENPRPQRPRQLMNPLERR